MILTLTDGEIRHVDMCLCVCVCVCLRVYGSVSAGVCVHDIHQCLCMCMCICEFDDAYLI